MFLHRITIRSKPGMDPQIVELIKAERQRVGRPLRIYRSWVGEQDRIAVEIDFGDMAEFQQFWFEYGDSPEGAEFFQELASLQSSATITEIWVQEE